MAPIPLARRVAARAAGAAVCAVFGAATLHPATLAPSVAWASPRPSPPQEQQAVPLEEKYAQVELMMDADCPLCAMLKRTPCWPPFLSFHKCCEYHRRCGEEDIATPCGKYALALNDCLEANAHLLPPEIASQRWQKDQKKPPPPPQGGSK